MSNNDTALAVHRASSASESQLVASTGRTTCAQSALAVALLGPEAEPFLQDPDMNKVAQYMYCTASFMVSYQYCQRYFDETDASRALTPVAGEDVPQELQQDTLKTLGEKLFIKLDGQARKFCEGWCTIQSLLTKDGLTAAFQAIDMQETLNEDALCLDAPLPVEQMADLLSAKKINKAVKSLQIKDTGGAVTMGQMFLMQMNNRQQSTGKVNALMEAITKSTKDIEGLEKKKEALEIDKAAHDAAVEDGKSKEKKMEEIAQNEESIITYLKDELARAKAEKAKWESELKAHTYRMYGIFHDMWKNDVALDKEKVEEWQRRIEKLEEQIVQCTKGKSASIQNQIVETNSKEIKKSEEKSKHAEKNIEVAQRNIERAEKKLMADQAKLERLVQQEGKYSAEHLLQANQAKNMLATVTSQTESNADVFASGWEKTLSEISILMFKCLEAKKLSSQKKILQKLQENLTSDKPLFQVLKKSRPIMSLMPSVIEDQPRYQRRQLAAAIEEIDSCQGCDDYNPSPEVIWIPDLSPDEVEKMLLQDDLKSAMQGGELDRLYSAIASAKLQAEEDEDLQKLLEEAQRDAEARVDANNRLEKAIGSTDVDALEEEVNNTVKSGCTDKVSNWVKARNELNRRRTALKEISNAMQSPSKETAMLEEVLDKFKMVKLPSQEFDKVRKELAERKQQAAAPAAVAQVPAPVSLGEFHPPARPQGPSGGANPGPINVMAMMEDDEDDETAGL